MSPANILKSFVLLATLATNISPAHATLIKYRADMSDAEVALEKQINDFDSQIEQEATRNEFYSDSVTERQNQIDSMYERRSEMSGNYGRESFKCQDHIYYKFNQCGVPSQYYGSKQCMFYRSCNQWFKKAGITEADIEAARRRLAPFQEKSDLSEQTLRKLRADRKELLKKAGRELRDPVDLAELPDGQSMEFKEALGLSRTINGFAISLTNDGCTFTLTPEEGSGQWSTGGLAKNYIWKFDYKNAETQEIKTVQQCSNQSVHPSQLKECQVGVRMDGRFLVQPSVVLSSNNYPGQIMRVEGSTGKDVLSCLVKRGFTPEKIMAKEKSADAQVQVQSSSMK